jgi:hypothetical protein
MERKFQTPLRSWDSQHARNLFRIYSIIDSPRSQ